MKTANLFSVIREDFTESDKGMQAFLSGQYLPVSTIKYADIMAGKTLTFKKIQQNQLHKQTDVVTPADSFVTVPRIIAQESFKEKTLVTIESDMKNNRLYFSADQTDSVRFRAYVKPFEIDSTVTISAYSKDLKGRKSTITRAVLHKMPHPEWKVSSLNKFSTQYHAGGADGLIDGIRGDENWRKGYWQGYWGNDAEFILDMGKTTAFDSVYAGFLQDTRAWIVMPVEVNFSFSDDGVTFKDTIRVTHPVRAEDYNTQILDFITGKTEKTTCRYIKIKAINYGKLPAWHLGAGGDAYIEGEAPGPQRVARRTRAHQVAAAKGRAVGMTLRRRARPAVAPENLEPRPGIPGGARHSWLVE